MKIDQNPFSLYDFLGYLIPGLLFVYSFYFIITFNFENQVIIPELSATYSGGKLPPDRALFLAYRVAGLKSRNICHLS